MDPDALRAKLAKPFASFAEINRAIRLPRLFTAYDHYPHTVSR
jgi:hypothetical protein